MESVDKPSTVYGKLKEFCSWLFTEEREKNFWIWSLGTLYERLEKLEHLKQGMEGWSEDVELERAYLVGEISKIKFHMAESDIKPEITQR